MMKILILCQLLIVKRGKKNNFLKNLKKYINDKKNLKDNPVLIMAGGRGQRLKEFTNYFPKPLVPINNETAIENNK